MIVEKLVNIVQMKVDRSARETESTIKGINKRLKDVQNSARLARARVNELTADKASAKANKDQVTGLRKQLKLLSAESNRLKVSQTELKGSSKASTAAFAGMLGKIFKVVAALTLLKKATVGAYRAFNKALEALTDYADENAKAAQRTGTTVEAFQALRFTAEVAGANVTELETGLRRMATTADQASRGAKASAEAYSRLGISVKDANGELKDNDALLLEIAEGLKNTQNDTVRMAIANQIFGRSGSKLLPILNKGAAGIRQYMQEANNLGFVLDSKTTVAAENYRDALLRLDKLKIGVKNFLVGPAIEEAAKNLDAFVKNFAALNKGNLKRAGQVLSKLFLFIQKTLLGVVKAVISFGSAYISAFGKAFEIGSKFINLFMNAVSTVFRPLTQAVKGFFGTFSGGAKETTTLLLAMLFPLLGVVEFIEFLEGKESLIANAFLTPEEQERFRSFAAEVIPKITEYTLAWANGISKVVSFLVRTYELLTDIGDFFSTDKLPIQNFSERLGELTQGNFLGIRIPGAFNPSIDNAAKTRATENANVTQSVGNIEVNVTESGASAEEIGTAVQKGVMSALNRNRRESAKNFAGGLA